jgi:hypothetical protein
MSERKPSVKPSRKFKKMTELPDKEVVRKLFPKRVVDAMNEAAGIDGQDKQPSETDK